MDYLLDFIGFSHVLESPCSNIEGKSTEEGQNEARLWRIKKFQSLYCMPVFMSKPLFMEFAFHNNVYDLDQALKCTYGLEPLLLKEHFLRLRVNRGVKRINYFLSLMTRDSGKIFFNLDAKFKGENLKCIKQDLSEESDMVVMRATTCMMFFLSIYYDGRILIHLDFLFWSHKPCL